MSEPTTIRDLFEQSIDRMRQEGTNILNEATNRANNRLVAIGETRAMMDSLPPGVLDLKLEDASWIGGMIEEEQRRRRRLHREGS